MTRDLSASGEIGIRFDAALHRRIGLEALQRGYLKVDELAEAMFVLGENPDIGPHDLWVRSQRLDRTELAEVIHGLQSILAEEARRDEPAGRGFTSPQFAVAGAAAPAEDDPEQSYTLADVEVTNGWGEPITLDEAYEGESQPEDSSDRVRTASGITTGAHKERYLLGGELGRGGVGRVIKAFDRDLGRTVAMKLPQTWPLSNLEADKFIEEAQATGQLEHPNIVPIYDIGQLDSGEFYYTMKRVRAHTLRDVLDKLKRKHPDSLREYGSTRLLSIFLQVCQAVHYAHVRGVIHRDLKPDNIMLGDYGEVHVMDWGLARVMDRDVVTNRSLQGSHKLETGQMLGTPAYMPPEQAQGRIDAVDERSDVYSLGVILYEMVTLTQPSTRDTVMATLMAVISEPIPPPRQVADNPVPEDLEFIILRALEKDPAARWHSAKAFADAVESFLDGRNEREAQRCMLQGETQGRIYEQAKREVIELSEAEREAAATIEDWQPVEVKRRLWELEDRRQRAANQMVLAFGNALREFTQALAHVPDLERATHSLARLHYSRYELAEREGNVLDQVYYLNLLEQYDDGTYLSRLRDSAPVSVYTNPTRASVFLYAYTERDRRLVPSEPTFAGETPLNERFIDAGRYLLRIKHPKYPAIQVPLHVNRSDPLSVNLTLPPREAFRPDAIWIPGGIGPVGGDPEAYDSLPLNDVQIDSFFLQRHPVTFREYIEFLDDLAAIDMELALECAPRTRGGDGLLVLWTDDGFVPVDDLIDEGLRSLYPRGEGHEWELPVVAIRHADAENYASWKREREGVAFRLPHELEWEYAARGGDNRVYTWGDRFDATYAKMTASRPSESQPEPVGVFPTDRSPFGVCDVSGTIREWTSGESADRTYAIARGGYWAGDERSCRCASRWRLHRSSRLATVGMRLAYDAE